MGDGRFSWRRVEWPTVALLIGCYLGWGVVTAFHSALGPFIFILIAAPLVTLHNSLQHEACHGHPTRSAALNEALVFLPLGLMFPYRRFKTLHLNHHNNSILTDPYDDPESFYYALSDWRVLPPLVQMVLNANNTFLGRFLIGPVVMLAGFVALDLKLIRSGERGVLRAWIHHGVGVALALTWTLWICGVPFWAYLIAAYLGISLLNVRTFAEHQAHEAEGGRTAIIEAGPFFALLFLNNNLHFVHHQNPRVPWYRLPSLYRTSRKEYLAGNDGYRFSGYGEVIRRHFLRRKDPVPHPYLRRS